MSDAMVFCTKPGDQLNWTRLMPAGTDPNEQLARRMVADLMRSPPKVLSGEPAAVHAFGIGIASLAAHDLLRHIEQHRRTAEVLLMETLCEIEYTKRVLLSFIEHVRDLQVALAAAADGLSTDFCRHLPEGREITALLLGAWEDLEAAVVKPYRDLLFQLPAEISWTASDRPSVKRQIKRAIESLCRVLQGMLGRSGSLVRAEHLAQGVVARLAWHWKQQLRTPRGRQEPQRHTGAFRLIALHELPLLAKRDESMSAKHGKRRVAKVFEEQLALIAQSLGFSIVSTQTGERTVDLVCIADSIGERLTFLLEAKTTSRPYSLPTKDERALLEYVSTVRGSLKYLPELRFVLIVGQAPSGTLQAKLLRLERTAGVPVRFCPADVIVSLREGIPGPVSANLFADAILRAPSILTKAFVQEVTRRHEAIQTALMKLVRMMSPHTGHRGPAL